MLFSRCSDSIVIFQLQVTETPDQVFLNHKYDLWELKNAAKSSAGVTDGHRVIRWA